ncbi:MAG: DMT family transporter [Verrucomicrobia bacterium]|nr:MAG: DMT family transporter [Verrucomicrobiota bacterium]
MKYYYLFPLLSSWFYVAGVMFIKQCSARGVGIWRITFVSNLVSAVMYVPLVFVPGDWPSLARLWEPALAACLFIGGQAFTFIALQKGDVSVATPVLGLKPVIVALFVVGILGDEIRPALWAAAGMSAAGVAMLNARGQSGRHHHVLSTIVLSLLAGSCFSLFDVLVQKFSGTWEIQRFLPAMFGFVSVFSLAFVRWFTGPLRGIRPEAWKPLGWGSFFLGLQGLVFISTVAVYGDATALNIIFSSRGLWSVVAVWWLGHWFGNTERDAGGRVLGLRLAGALVMLAAIALVLV